MFLLCSLFVLVSSEHTLPSESISRDENTRQVIFGTRHGNRNPETILPSPSGPWGEEGAVELTETGKRQAYGLGKEMRKFVDGLVSPNFLASSAQFYTSSANRCQMTLQAALAGLYPPPIDWTSGLDWTPVPYTINDPLLRMYSVSACTTSNEAWDPITNDELPDLQELAKKNADLLDYMKENTGLNATISNAADIADNIIDLDFLNASYPKWLSNPTLPGYNASTIRSAFLKFSEAHQIRCATYIPCRNMMGGYWVEELLKMFENKKVNIVGYASHTEITLSVMKILGYLRNELTTSAGFVLEVKEENNDINIRYLVHDPNPVEKHVIYKGTLVPELASKADSNGFLSIADVKAYVQGAAFSDWEQVCSMNKCASSSPSPSTESSPLQSSTAPSSCMLLISFFVILFS